MLSWIPQDIAKKIIYLLTTLFNAPLTMNNYYQAEVQHDFGL